MINPYFYMFFDFEFDSIKSDIYSDELKLDVLTLKPMIKTLIGDVKGNKILDFGCGSGRFSKLMGEIGAEVIALDISSAQIELAKKINSNNNVKFLAGGGLELERFSEKSFDLILINMVFPSIDNQREAEKIMSEVGRILKTDGKLIISLIHPLF